MNTSDRDQQARKEQISNLADDLCVAIESSGTRVADEAAKMIRQLVKYVLDTTR